MKDIQWQTVVTDMFYKCGIPPLTDTPPEFSDITIRRVSGNSHREAALIAGLPERRLRRVTLEDIEIAGAKGLMCCDTDGLRMYNVRIRAAAEPGMMFVRTSDLRLMVHF